MGAQPGQVQPMNSGGLQAPITTSSMQSPLGGPAIGQMNPSITPQASGGLQGVATQSLSGQPSITPQSNPYQQMNSGGLQMPPMQQAMNGGGKSPQQGGGK